MVLAQATDLVPELAPFELEFFEQNGFLFLERFTTDEEVRVLREIYDRLFAERAGWDEGLQFDLAGNERDDKLHLPQLLSPSKYAPELRETAYVTNARRVASQILGDELQEGYGEHMIYKPARYGAVTPWHQDQAYHDPTVWYRSVNFWMPLDDATVESGCMQFVPGSHRRDVLPHHSIGNDPAVHGLEVDEPAKYAEYAVACPIPAGGCTMHASYMLHYAAANSSDKPRRAYILHFVGRHHKRTTPIDNYWIRQQQTPRMQRAAAARAEAVAG